MDRPIVLVTGGTGLLGTAICRDLAESFQVIGLDVAKPSEFEPEVTYLRMDVTSDESVASTLEAVRDQFGDQLASAIHLAAYYDFSGEPSRLYDEVTVNGTRRLLRHLRNFDLDQFVFSSTMLVHRPADPPERITEDDALEGKWDYPQSKIEAERAIRESRGDVPVVLLRIAGVYSDYCDSLPLAQQIRRIAENRITSHVFPGDTSHGQSFVHIDDVTSAVRQLIERRKQLGPEEVFLLGEPDTYSYDEIQRALGRLIRGDEEWTTRRIPKAIAKTGAALRDKAQGDDGAFIKPWMIDFADDHYALDVSRAREKLGWKPAHRLIDTLPKMVGALRNSPSEWYKDHGMDGPPADVFQ